jgi:hypothetical protein
VLFGGGGGIGRFDKKLGLRVDLMTSLLGHGDDTPFLNDMHYLCQVPVSLLYKLKRCAKPDIQHIHLASVVKMS